MGNKKAAGEAARNVGKVKAPTKKPANRSAKKPSNSTPAIESLPGEKLGLHLLLDELERWVSYDVHMESLTKSQCDDKDSIWSDTLSRYLGPVQEEDRRKAVCELRSKAIYLIAIIERRQLSTDETKSVVAGNATPLPWSAEDELPGTFPERLRPGMRISDVTIEKLREVIRRAIAELQELQEWKVSEEELRSIGLEWLCDVHGFANCLVEYGQALPAELNSALTEHVGDLSLDECIGRLRRLESATYVTAADEIADEASSETSEHESPKVANHSPDFASVHWFGKNYTFTPNQAACVSALWEAWEDGTPTVGEAAIQEKAEIASSLRSLFHKHPAWGILIVSPLKGRYALQEPGEETHA